MLRAIIALAVGVITWAVFFREKEREVFWFNPSPEGLAALVKSHSFTEPAPMPGGFPSRVTITNGDLVPELEG